MSSLRKPVPEGAVPMGSPVPQVSRWGEQYPNLVEWLTACRYPDGDPRETSTVVISYEQGTFKACLNDRDGKRSLWVSGMTPDDVLGRLEAALGADAQEWRAWRDSGKGRGARR